MRHGKGKAITIQLDRSHRFHLEEKLKLE